MKDYKKQLWFIAVLFTIVAILCPTSVVMADEWVSPTGNEDPNGTWHDEPQAYNNDVWTGAYCDAHGTDTWSDFLVLTTPRIWCSGVRYWMHSAFIIPDNYNKIDIDLYYNSAWHDLYEGTYAQGLNPTWVDKHLTSPQYVSAMRVRYFNHDWNPRLHEAFEFDFYEQYTTAETVLRGLLPSVSAIGVVLALLAVIGKGNPHSLLYAGITGGVVFVSVMALVNSML